MTFRPPSREPLPSWSSDRILIFGFLARTSLQPFTRSITAETCGPFWMIDLAALGAELVGDVLAGDLAGLDVVGLHRGVGAGRGDVDRDHHDPGRLRPLDRRGDRLGVGGVEQDHVDARGDEVVDLVELLVQVVVGRGGVDRDVRVDLLGLGLGALGQGHEERVAERAQRDPDRVQVLGRGGPGRERRAPRRPATASSTSCSLRFLAHVRGTSGGGPASRRGLRRPVRAGNPSRIRSGRCPGVGSGRAPPRR